MNEEPAREVLQKTYESKRSALTYLMGSRAISVFCAQQGLDILLVQFHHLVEALGVNQLSQHCLAASLCRDPLDLTVHWLVLGALGDSVEPI